MVITPIYIYGLFESGSDSIRYIGKTIKTPQNRLREHLNELKRKRCDNQYRQRWMKRAVASGKTIDVRIVEVILSGSWESRERHWIAFYRKLGHPLTNLTPGGEGFLAGADHPLFGTKNPQVAARNRARRGIPNPAISAVKKGTTNPFLTQLNRQRRGQKRPKDVCDKISSGLKGKPKAYMVERNKKMSGPNHPFFGKKRPNFSAKMRGRKHTLGNKT